MSEKQIILRIELSPEFKEHEVQVPCDAELIMCGMINERVQLVYKADESSAIETKKFLLIEGMVRFDPIRVGKHLWTCLINIQVPIGPGMVIPAGVDPRKAVAVKTTTISLFEVDESEQEEEDSEDADLEPERVKKVFGAQ